MQPQSALAYLGPGMRALVRSFGRYGLRFLCFYWICFTFPFPLDLVGLPFAFMDPSDQPEWMRATNEGFNQAYLWIHNQKNEACKLVGANILQVEVIIQLTGSGDTMRAYVGCFCALVTAAALALLWAPVRWGLRRWKPMWDPDATLLGLTRVLVRFFLIEMLFGYGFAKAFPLQFPPPGSYRLSEQVGDMSPMGLLWTFMGFSPAYEVFTGTVEVLAGLLLTTRRTTLLGALVATAAMGQVFVLNMCFDVPVKLYSFHYLMMAIFLAAPELPRLANVLVLGRGVPALPLAPLLGSVRFDRFAAVFRTLLVAAMLGAHIQGGLKQWEAAYGALPVPGGSRWDVVGMCIDGKEPSKSDPPMWTWLEFTNKTILRLAGSKPPPLAYRMTWDPDRKELTISRIGGPTSSATFVYELPEPDRLELRGTMEGKAIQATLQRAPEKQYPLMARGFHWVQELPYNR
jgi:hypothetical protein